MWISGIEAQCTIFRCQEEIQFMPGINIVRGENGVGKTTVLEFASLIGHVTLMQRAETHDDDGVNVRIVLDNTDRTFLKYVKENEGAIFEESGRSQEFTAFAQALVRAKIDRKAFATIDQDIHELSLRFQFIDAQSNHLKDVLSRDQKIAEFIRVHGDNTHILAIKLLNCWTRPFCTSGAAKPPGPWTITPRTIRAYSGLVDACEANGNQQKSAVPACGAAFYINTDMYEFGAGLDVRESPKELKEHLSTTLINRLQLLRPTGNGVAAGVDYCQQFAPNVARNLHGFDELSRLWGEVFEHHHPLRSFQATKPDAAQSDKFNWTIEIGTQRAGQFVSSGENQALFILSLLCNVASAGSCVMIDEPELHLTFSAGTRLLNTIFKESRDHERSYQVIIVTHLPHLHRDRVAEVPENASDWPTEKINFIYLDSKTAAGVRPFYGSKGVDAAASSSQDDVVMIARGLALDKEISIFFGLRALWTWLGAIPSRVRGRLMRRARAEEDEKQAC